MNAEKFEIALPTQELVNRDRVELTHLLDRYPAAMYSLDNRRLSPNGPPPDRGRRKLRHRCEGIGLIIVCN
jgi:hypothetical protein